MDELLTEVPKKLHPRFREIVALTDAFCAAHLNDEYRDICRRMAAAACAEGLPVAGGKAAGWAAGVVAAVAYVNFLTSDASLPFHMPPADIAKRAGVSLATLNSKSKAIRDALGADRFDPRFSTRAMTDSNPMTWMLSVNGLLMDIRQAPRGAQEEALRRGLIPYIPGDEPREKPAPKGGEKKGTKAKSASPRVYTFDVTLLDGPVTDDFVKKNKVVRRTIEIRGGQTLEDLHEAIFDAFDRDDPHMYEFQFGTKPMERDAPRYVMKFAMEDDDGPEIQGLTEETTIDDLELKPKAVFWYWFDFGDDWHHKVELTGVADGVGKGKYPRVTNRVGKSPPQYPEWDEE